MWTPQSSWLTSLTFCPSPGASPTTATVLAMRRAAAGPARPRPRRPTTMISRSPSAARATPPDTGASTTSTPGRPASAPSAPSAPGPTVAMITATVARRERVATRRLAEEHRLHLLGRGDHQDDDVGVARGVRGRPGGGHAVALAASRRVPDRGRRRCVAARAGPTQPPSARPSRPARSTRRAVIAPSLRPARRAPRAARASASATRLHRRDRRAPGARGCRRRRSSRPARERPEVGAAQLRVDVDLRARRPATAAVSSASGSPDAPWRTSGTPPCAARSRGRGSTSTCTGRLVNPWTVPTAQARASTPVRPANSTACVGVGERHRLRVGGARPPRPPTPPSSASTHTPAACARSTTATVAATFSSNGSAEPSYMTDV